VAGWVMNEGWQGSWLY